MAGDEAADLPLADHIGGRGEGDGRSCSRRYPDHRAVTVLFDELNLIRGRLHAVEKILLVAVGLALVHIHGASHHELMFVLALVNQLKLDRLARRDANRVGLEGELAQFHLDRGLAGLSRRLRLRPRFRATTAC